PSETDLTAFLGWLIANAPSEFSKLLGINKIQQVKLEQKDDSGRHDITVECANESIVIEAKVGFEQNQKQIKRYLDHLRRQKKRVSLILLDRGSQNNQSINEARGILKNTRIKYLTWEAVAQAAESIAKSKMILRTSRDAPIMAEHLLRCLEEMNMRNHSTDHGEIYLRDLSGRSVELFFKHHIYKCQPMFLNSARRATYFAPIFTSKAPKDIEEKSLISIGLGVSFIARIQDCRLVERKQIEDHLKSYGRDNVSNVAQEIRSQSKLKQVLILLLGKPQQLFMTPVTKKQLGIHGMTGSITKSLDWLLEAAHGSSKL
ncbi:MAG: PD-(D/E)XK nuclease family protein, partial [Elusimicrobiota bacterium]